MDINIKDTVVLSNNIIYIVVSKINHEKDTYYYLVDKYNNKHFKFCIEKIASKSLLEIEDKSLIQQLLPFFLKATSKAVTKEDLELIMDNN